MTLEEVVEKIKEPEKLIDPRVIDELLFWISSWLTDYEESLSEVDQQVAIKRLDLVEVHKSVAKANAYLEMEDIYLQQQAIERRIRQLKAFKANLRRRFDLLTNNFR